MQEDKEDKLVLKKRVDRFKDARFIEDVYSSLEWRKHFSSFKNEEEKFTNFAKSQAAQNYKDLKVIIKEYGINQNTLNSLFQGDELLDNSNIERVIRLLNSNAPEFNLKREDILHLQKYRLKWNPNIQLYMVDRNKKLHLLAVDIFHLIIPAMNRNGIYIAENKYFKNKNNKLNIKTLLESPL